MVFAGKMHDVCAADFAMLFASVPYVPAVAVVSVCYCCVLRGIHSWLLGIISLGLAGQTRHSQHYRSRDSIAVYCCLGYPSDLILSLVCFLLLAKRRMSFVRTTADRDASKVTTSSCLHVCKTYSRSRKNLARQLLHHSYKSASATP